MQLVRSLLLLALSAPCAARAQQPAAPASAAKPADAYLADAASFTIGRRVYLRSTKAYIGTVVDTAAKHDFRAGHFPRPWMKAVLIERRDGPHEWVPIEGITRLYVVK